MPPRFPWPLLLAQVALACVGARLVADELGWRAVAFITAATCAVMLAVFALLTRWATRRGI